MLVLYSQSSVDHTGYRGSRVSYGPPRKELGYPSAYAPDSPPRWRTFTGGPPTLNILSPTPTNKNLVTPLLCSF